MPCLLPPSALGNRGGARRSSAAPIPTARGSGAAPGGGERKRGAREVDPRPQLGRRRPKMAWPRRPAVASDVGPGPVSQRGGGGQGEGEEYQWTSGVPKPTSNRAEGQWKGELRGGRCSGWRRWWVVVLGGREGGRGAEGRRWGVFYCRARSVERRGVGGQRCGGRPAVRGGVMALRPLARVGTRRRGRRGRGRGDATPRAGLASGPAALCGHSKAAAVVAGTRCTWARRSSCRCGSARSVGTRCTREWG